MSAGVQLWSMAEDAKVLELLRFPCPPLIPSDARMNVSFLDGVRRRAVPKKTTDEIIAYLGTCRTDEIKVNYKFEPYTIPNTDVTIHKVFSMVNVSPTNCLATYGNWLFPFCRIHGVTRAPTVLETIMEYTSNLPTQKVFDILSRGLAESLASVPGHVISGGSGGYGLNVLLHLARWPKAYPMLDEKWDYVHPIMIGPLPRCAALAQALGDVVDLIEVNGNGPPLGVIRILEKGWQLVDVWLPNSAPQRITVPDVDTLRPRAQPWLVPLDETTLYDSARAEMKKGGSHGG